MDGGDFVNVFFVLGITFVPVFQSHSNSGEETPAPAHDFLR